MSYKITETTFLNIVKKPACPHANATEIKNGVAKAGHEECRIRCKGNYFVGGECNYGGIHTLKKDLLVINKNFAFLDDFYVLQQELQAVSNEQEFNKLQKQFLDKVDNLSSNVSFEQVEKIIKGKEITKKEKIEFWQKEITRVKRSLQLGEIESREAEQQFLQAQNNLQGRNDDDIVENLPERIESVFTDGVEIKKTIPAKNITKSEKLQKAESKKNTKKKHFLRLQAYLNGLEKDLEDKIKEWETFTDDTAVEQIPDRKILQDNATNLLKGTCCGIENFQASFTDKFRQNLRGASRNLKLIAEQIRNKTYQDVKEYQSLFEKTEELGREIKGLQAQHADAVRRGDTAEATRLMAIIKKKTGQYTKKQEELQKSGLGEFFTNDFMKDLFKSIVEGDLSEVIDPKETEPTFWEKNKNYILGGLGIFAILLIFWIFWKKIIRMFS